MDLITFILALVALRPKVADKFIDAIGRAFSPTFGPMLNAVNSHFHAHVLETTAKAEARTLALRLEALRTNNVKESDLRLLKLLDATSEKALEHLESNDPIASFSNAQIERKLKNRLRIAATAITYLPVEVSPEAVDEEFIHRFFRNSEDVSNHAMQSLWAKILAGELNKPGSFGPRTLDALRSLSQAEAENFTKYCSLVWEVGSGKCVIRRDNERILNVTEFLGLNLRDLRQLEYSGLVHLGTLVTQEIKIGDRFKYFDLHNLEAKCAGQIVTSPLTFVGEELFPLCGAVPDTQYGVRTHQQLARFFSKPR
ncbi:MAG: DUF2806 domain-containing protein [Rhodospirillaceae bacterium]|nr:DUF2806 domain-containing protein [Rhodospirillaceae bacterium]